MFRRIHHEISKSATEKIVRMTIKYQGDPRSLEDVLVLIADAWYQQMHELGMNPVEAMKVVEEVFNESPGIAH